MSKVSYLNQGSLLADDRSLFGEVRHQAGWLIVLGVALVVIGVVAINHSFSSTLVTMVFLGWMVIAAGVAQIVQAFRSGKIGLFLLHVLVGILYGVVGFEMVANPGISAVSFTLLIASIFMISGIFRVCAAIALRGPGSGWLAFNGVITFLLGLVVHNQWPVSGAWLIGTFLGIDFVMSGVHLFTLGVGARTLIPKTA